MDIAWLLAGLLGAAVLIEAVVIVKLAKYIHACSAILDDTLKMVMTRRAFQEGGPEAARASVAAIRELEKPYKESSKKVPAGLGAIRPPGVSEFVQGTP
jgi:hypothetical protein